MTCACKICGADANFFSPARILGKYSINYSLCSNCGFVSTEDPYWLDEAYSTAISSSDVGLVQRNISLSKIASVIISLYFDKSGVFLDYAGGYGLFVRLMRDNGFDFRWHDKYCENIFACVNNSDASSSNKIELITAFEVFEHFLNPVSSIEEMLASSRNVLFSTELLPDPVPQPDNWWYYGLDHGQHISFYTRRTLEIVAKKSGLNFYTDGHSIHLFSDKKINNLLFCLATRSYISSALAPLCRRKSLLKSDYKSLTGDK